MHPVKVKGTVYDRQHSRTLYVIINLFIAVVINNLEQAKTQQLKELRQPVSRDKLLDELAITQQALVRLRERIERTT